MLSLGTNEFYGKSKDKWNEHLVHARTLGSHTQDEWEAMKRFYKFHCVRCHRKCDGRVVRLTIDHIIPISEGGDDSISNIQPLCQQCNSRKGQRTLDYRLRFIGHHKAKYEVVF